MRQTHIYLSLIAKNVDGQNPFISTRLYLNDISVRGKV